MNNELPFLGQGWSFPPAFSKGGSEVELVSGVKDIQQSLEILLGTQLNERALQEDFGSSLSDFQFEDISPAVLNRMENRIEEAVLYHEARIEVHAIRVEVDRDKEGVLLIQVDFTVSASNSRFNMVYPFYLMEANY